MKVKVYSTSTCPYCHSLKAYLKDNAIEFEDVVLDNEPDQIGKFQDTCGSMAVPCTHITFDDGDEKVVVGFDKPQLDKALKLN